MASSLGTTSAVIQRMILWLPWCKLSLFHLLRGLVPLYLRGNIHLQHLPLMQALQHRLLKVQQAAKRQLQLRQVR
jgi:hypothetical protein